MQLQSSSRLLSRLTAAAVPGATIATKGHHFWNASLSFI
jgi:hypothetical protein